MQIVVNHLTRMQSGFACVAGTDLQTGQFVRPVLGGARLTTGSLARYGGPFDIGNVVDLGAARTCGAAPEVEDHRFDPAQARFVRVQSDATFWATLTKGSRPTLHDIFGPDLLPRGWHSFGVDLGKGISSLGLLSPTGAPELFVRTRPNKPPQVRIRFSDGTTGAEAGLTDIRFYAADHQTVDHNLVAAVDARMKTGTPVILAVGLTRPFATSSQYAPLHWLQVNGIHLGDRPIWQLG